MQRVPNLFSVLRNQKDIERYYSLYLAKLLAARRSARAIEASHCIRHFAKQAGKPKAGLFTYAFELLGYEDSGNVNAMWRVTRAWDRAVIGKKIDLQKHRWKNADDHRLIFLYAPLLYLRGDYRTGCQLLEKALEMYSYRKGWAFEMLWHIYKPIQQPITRYDVTLAHFYRVLGRDLREWPLWDKFVNDFRPELFVQSEVSRESLCSDSSELHPFFEWISSERKRRLFSHTTMGEVDLIESRSKVKQRQSSMVRAIKQRSADPERQRREEKLNGMFPELKELTSSKKG